MMTGSSAVEWHSQIAAEFDAKYATKPNFLERYKIWTDIISRYSNGGYTVCDLGCGSGVFSLYAATMNNNVIGVDGSSEMIGLCNDKKKAQGVSNVEFTCMDIKEFLTDKIAAYDVILCSSVMEYFNENDELYKCLKISLKNDGVLLCSLPNGDSLYRKVEKLVFNCTGFPKYYEVVKYLTNIDKLRNKFGETGFSCLEYHYYAATPVISKIFRGMGMEKYSDNLFLMAFRKNSK